MLLSGGTYNDCGGGMSLNRPFEKEHRLRASVVNVLDCFHQCWDLQEHQARTNLATAQIGVCSGVKRV